MDFSPLLLGLDIGTTNIKAVVFDRTGQVVASASVKTPTHFPQPGWAYYKPDEIWNSTVEALRQVTAHTPEPKRIASVAVASIGETGFPMDARGACTYDAIAWFDARSQAQSQWLAQVLGREHVFTLTGLSLQHIFSLCKILWIKDNEPEAFGRTVRWLNTADYIAYRLSGVQATDYSLASRTMALNIRKLQWEHELINAAGVSPDLFAPLLPSGSRLGTIRPELATSVGLPAHVQVAVGGHDHVCGAAAAGVIDSSAMLDSIGTAEALLLPLDQPLTDPKMTGQGYEQGAHVAGGYYTFPSFRTAGACIDWFRSTCAGGASYAELIAEAELTPPGSLGVRFMPHMRPSNSPYIDPKSRATFVGITTDTTRGAMFRAVLEGLAFEARAVLEPLSEYIDLSARQAIYAIGGVTRNLLLMQLKATLLNKTISIVNINEETALGAAILGGVGAGVYANLPDAIASLRYTTTAVEPDAAQVEFYDAAFCQVYQGIYPALRPVNHANFELLR